VLITKLGNELVFSVLFKYLGNRKTYGENVLHI
jgi:hypothetical protein